MKWFLVYAGILVLHAIFESEEKRQHIIGILYTLIQLLVFFWLSAEVMKDEKIAVGVLRTYALA